MPISIHVLENNNSKMLIVPSILNMKISEKEFKEEVYRIHYQAIAADSIQGVYASGADLDYFENIRNIPILSKEEIEKEKRKDIPEKTLCWRGEFARWIVWNLTSILL